MTQKQALLKEFKKGKVLQIRIIMKSKYVYWCNLQLAGYNKQITSVVKFHRYYNIIVLNPITNTGDKQQFTESFFTELLAQKSIEKLTHAEYKIRLKLVEERTTLLGSYLAKKMFVSAKKYESG